MLRAYCDMSCANGWTVLGGYVAPPQKWVELEAAWKANLSYWGLDDFHLVDLPRRMGHEKADICISSFASVVGEARLDGVHVAVENAFYDARPFNRETYPSCYHLCADMLLEQLNTHADLNFGGGPITAIFDRDTQDQQAVHALVDADRGINKIAALSFSDRKSTPLLQTADLAAGVARREWVEKNYLGELPRTNKVLANALGKRNFGSTLSFESERQREELRALYDPSAAGGGE